MCGRGLVSRIKKNMSPFIRGRKIRGVGREEGRKGRKKGGQRRANETEMKNAKSVKATDFREASMSASTSTTIVIHPAPFHAAPTNPLDGLMLMRGGKEETSSTAACPPRTSTIAEQTHTYNRHTD